jgi:hypothetical protein
MADRTVSRKLIEDLMFGTGRVRRFTQDSPVLPDVWLEYAMSHVGQGDADDERRTKKTSDRDPHPPVRLLLTPHADTNTGLLARRLRERVNAERRKPEWRRFGAADPSRAARVVYNGSTVAAELYFEDLVRVVLPMTDWWHRAASPLLIDRTGVEWLPLVKDPEHASRRSAAAARVRPEMLWMIRVVGVLALEHRNDPLPAALDAKGLANASDAEWTRVIDAALDLATRNFTAAGREARIFSVSLNREAGPTVFRSTLSVKADAARRLFAIDCSQLVWAVVDSGIDARHPAFRVRDDDAPGGERGAIRKAPFGRSKTEAQNNTRVKATYDFTGLHLLLDPAERDEVPEPLRKRLKGRGGADLRKKLAALYDSVEQGRPLDWGLLAPLLEVPHDATYVPPGNDHGTHVAGILAGDWRTYDDAGAGLEGHLTGVCPDLRLYDLRVLDDTGRGDEFAVMAALQLVRHLNVTNDFMSIHGVNLSLSIPHDVSNYACGRTPICEECERVVSAGVVVVAAAGNQGYRKMVAPDGVTMELYSSSSITDPGNADQVITVGATHRYRPHMYGVSYFSSRGPTGDGRIKPDLVAPGEKITAPLPNSGYGVKDGTSMAAPHVSGAAALLMARHNELVGRPARIKQVLCSTATDLGRERYFQGAGMLDILRALQSI